MGDPSSRREALSLLGEAYWKKRTGVLSVEAEDVDLRVAVGSGEIVGICPPPGAAAPAADPFADPDDSAKLKLDRILVEVGLRRPDEGSNRSVGASTGPSAVELRERLLSLLANGGERARFDETADLPEDALPAPGATEPLILEAVRRVDDPKAIQGLLGDLDRRLTAAAGRTEERTLTLTEGALLSRIDGVGTARQILQSVPLEADDARRGLAGLLLIGRVRHSLMPPSPAAKEEPREKPDPPPGTIGAQAESSSPSVPQPQESAPSQSAPSEAEPSEAEPSESPSDAAGPMDAEAQAARQEILGLFQSLPRGDHFQVLGVEPGSGDAEIRRAYVARVKRYHPDAQRDPALADLHDVLEAIFVRVSGAWEVLGDAKSRADYETRLSSGAGRPGDGGEAGPARPEGDGSADEGQAREESASEKTLREAEHLLGESRYWDAIQMLESAVPRLQPEPRQHQGRILLAQAYAHNPKWIRRAEKTLQRVVREDPANADAHYELGVLYKAGGLTARAQAMFRKAVELQPDHRQAAAQTVSDAAPPPAGFLRRLFRGRDKGA